jgi:hypothetical protein
MIAGRLERYCRFTTSDADTPPVGLPVDAQQERAIVLPQSDPPGGWWELVTNRLDTFAGTPSTIPTAANTVTVTVLDSSPTSVTYAQALTRKGLDAHGMVVSSIVHRLTCPGVSPGNAAALCPISLRTQLATPTVLSTDSDTPGMTEVSQSGGQIGTLSQLADAIVDATDAVTGPHIINMSLAWHPTFGGILPGSPTPETRNRHILSGADPQVAGRDPTWPVGVLSVYDALHYARCRGVLTIVSAGNVSSGPMGGEGMLLPAAWATIPASALESCALLEDSLIATDVPQAIVHPVGVIGHDDTRTRKSPLSRPNGQPHLVAYGIRGQSADATLPVSLDGGLVAENQAIAMDEGVWPRSGTSVSAPVVSATAAILWANNPSSSPEQVIDTIHANAQRTTTAPATWLQGRGWSPSQSTAISRYVRLCDVLQQSGIPTPCLPAVSSTLSPLAPTPIQLTHQTAIARRECGGFVYGGSLDLTVNPNSNPCPSKQLYDPLIAGGVHPQAPKDPCPVCTIRPVQNQIYIDVLHYENMKDLTLVAVMGGSKMLIGIPDQTTAAGRVFEVQAVDLAQLEEPLLLTGHHEPSHTSWSVEFIEVWD